MNSQAKHPLILSAEALEAEAELPRNLPHRHAMLLTAAHNREEAKRLPEMWLKETA
jgi:hypothetical protein